MNCGRCKKNKPIEELANVVTKEGMVVACLKCQKLYQKEYDLTGEGAGIEIEKINGQVKTFMTCKHCGLRTDDSKYFMSHDCTKFVMTKEFIEKGGLGK